MDVSVEQFVKSLTNSGLMASEEAAALQDRHAAVDGEEIASALVRQGKLTEYQARAICNGQTKHLTLGDYKILEKIGEGGMAQVFKARHRRLERLAAIKILPDSALNTPGAVDRFHQEVKTAARLTHPNIVITFDASEQDGVHYLVMEYVEGKDLATVLNDRGPLSVPQALDAVTQAARGLEYAHRRGIVHRDVKPSNLLLDKEGQVKILDMGLARMATEVAPLDATKAERLTTIGQVMGTFDYMSPEQAEDARNADRRSDVYSLGCTLFRLLTGSAPYSGDTMIQILLAHREAALPSLSAHCADAPERLDLILRKAIAKRPEDRFQSMSELIDNIEVLQSVSQAPVRLVDGPSDSRPSLSALVAETSANQVGAAVPPATASEAETIDHAAQLEDTSKQGLPAEIIVDAVVVAEPDVSVVHITDAESSPVVKSHRAAKILALGALGILLSWCLVGGVFGVIAWVRGYSDLGEMRAGRMDPSGKGTTQAGMILGIVATIIVALSIWAGSLSLW